MTAPLQLFSDEERSRLSEVELTILMPCLNEAETLAVCIRKAFSFLERNGVSGEVLIADNGSTDGSRAIAENLGARVIKVAVRGYGAALHAGFEAAHGRFIVMGDADDSYDFSDLSGFVDALRDGADLVVGNRFKGQIAPGAMPWLHKYVGNPALSIIGRVFYRVPIGDFHCGLRGVRRASMLELPLSSQGMEFASEMIVRASMAKLNVREVQTVLHPDGRSRRPHLRTWRDGWRHLRLLLLHSPRWLFIYPGAAIFLAGAILSLLLATGPMYVLPGVSLDVHSLIVACFALVVGAQCMLFGIIARWYAAAQGFLPPSDRLARLPHITLERLLVASGFLLVAGVSGLVYSISTWAAADFGPLHYGQMIRTLTLSCAAIALAFQLGFAAFLAAILALSRSSPSSSAEKSAASKG